MPVAYIFISRGIASPLEVQFNVMNSRGHIHTYIHTYMECQPASNLLVGGSIRSVFSFQDRQDMRCGVFDNEFYSYSRQTLDLRTI